MTNTKIEGKNPYTIEEVSLISKLVKLTIENNSSKSLDKLKIYFKSLSHHMEDYDSINEMYKMLPDEMKSQFRLPVGDIITSKKDEENIQNLFKDKSFDEAHDVILDMLNKSNVSFIHFENLKKVYNKTKQSLELYEGLKKLKNKSDAIIDVYGDPFNGVLDDILKNNESLR